MKNNILNVTIGLVLGAMLSTASTAQAAAYCKEVILKQSKLVIENKCTLTKFELVHNNRLCSVEYNCPVKIMLQNRGKPEIKNFAFKGVFEDTDVLKRLSPVFDKIEIEGYLTY